MSKTVIVVAGLVLAFTVIAQESPSYRLSDHTFNAGGHPFAGTVLGSTSYRITMDSIGDGVVAPDLSSASYHMDGGFTGCYPPPGEVFGLYFTDDETLVWDAEPSVGTYNLYRDLVSQLAGLGYGDCEQQALSDTTTIDTDTPATSGDGFFYLVTAENRLDEEGSKGFDSLGSLRPNPDPCP